MSLPDNQALVYYVGFDVELITGIPEHQIEEYGCLYKINQKDFEQSLLTDKESTKNIRYEKLDVRAKVIFPDRTYFVSHTGVVNTGKDFVLLDKTKFANRLISFKKCQQKLSK